MQALLNVYYEIYSIVWRTHAGFSELSALLLSEAWNRRRQLLKLVSKAIWSLVIAFNSLQFTAMIVCKYFWHAQCHMPVRLPYSRGGLYMTGMLYWLW